MNLVKTSRGLRNIVEDTLVDYSVKNDHNRGLHKAVLRNNIPLAKKFIAHKDTDLDEFGTSIEEHIALFGQKRHPSRYNIALCSTPLFLAIWQGHEDMACLLLDSGANPNAVLRREWPNVLQQAIMLDRAKCVRKLLEKGFNRNDLEGHYHGHAVTRQAIENGNIDILILLVDDIASRYPKHLQYHLDGCLYNAAEMGRLEMVKMLFKKGAVIESLIHWPASALYQAILHACPEVVAFLLQNGADIAHDLTTFEKSCLAVAVFGFPGMAAKRTIEALWVGCRALTDDAQRAAVERILEEASGHLK